MGLPAGFFGAMPSGIAPMFSHARLRLSARPAGVQCVKTGAHVAGFDGLYCVS